MEGYDLILHNGKIRTMDEDSPLVEAVGIKGNKILKIGSDADILAGRISSSKVIDLRGRLTLPGFIDSHLHLAKSITKGILVDLSDCRSIEDIIMEGRRFIEENEIGAGQWIIGRGWNQDYFKTSRRFPNKNDLDKISREHPVAFLRTCGHIIVGNTLAIREADFTSSTEKIEGGEFDLDQDGHPNGIFRERAMDIFMDNIPEESVEDKKKAILLAIDGLHREGITSVHTDDFTQKPLHYKRVLKAYDELKKEGRLKARIYQQCLLQDMDELGEFLDSGYRTGDGDEYYRIGPLKLLGDGALGARTAALSKAYADDGDNKGIAIFSQDELDQMILTAHRNGMQVAVHGIGDEIISMTLNSIEKALEKYPRKDHRHSIVHCQITSNQILDRFKELNVTALVQPIFIEYDWKIVEDRVGVELARTSYNWRGFLNRNVDMAFGSDSPVEPFGAIRGIYHAVSRKDISGQPSGGWMKENAVNVEEAVYSFTRAGAKASFEEDIKGSISPGKLADIVVLEEDIFNISEDDIKDVRVDMTIFDGNLVYER